MNQSTTKLNEILNAAQWAPHLIISLISAFHQRALKFPQNGVLKGIFANWAENSAVIIFFNARPRQVLAE